MSVHENFLQATGLDPAQLTDEQLRALYAVQDPRDLKPEETIALFKKMGLDIKDFTQKRTKTSARNGPCSCGSQKKYKKCCGK